MMYKDTPNPAQQIFVHKKHGSRSPGFMGHLSYPAVYEFDYLPVYNLVGKAMKFIFLPTEFVHSSSRTQHLGRDNYLEGKTGILALNFFEKVSQV